MLVLTRKVGESIRIGDEIEVVITAVEQNKVKIGIRSPRCVPVYREEIYQKIQLENREAACLETTELDQVLEKFKREEPLASSKGEED